MRTTSSHWIGLLLFAGLALSACDDAFIDPFSNDGKYFTVYGFLDQSKNFQPGAMHVVRVIPITRTPERIEDPSQPQAVIDARVITTDLNTGIQVEWTHSLDRLENGLYGHFFSARFFVEPNHVYRLEVLRTDGTVTYAETQVPATSSIRLEPGAIRVSADSTQIQQDFELPLASSVWEIDMVYHLGGPSCFTSSRTPFPYGRTGRSSASGWAFTADISRDYAQLSERLGTSPMVCAMGLQAKVLDEKWQFPEGELDLEALALPDRLTNVVNGYGFFGSVGVFQYDWPISDELSVLLSRPAQ